MKLAGPNLPDSDRDFEFIEDTAEYIDKDRVRLTNTHWKSEWSHEAQKLTFRGATEHVMGHDPRDRPSTVTIRPHAEFPWDGKRAVILTIDVPEFE